MQPKSIHIVCTRKLPDEMIAEAATQGIYIHSFDFLQIRLLPVSDFEHQVINFNHPLVFTSVYAVEALLPLAPKLTSKNVFAIDGNTSKTAIQAGFNISATAHDAAALAKKIAATGTQKVLHCTTLNRRNELKDGLLQAGVEYKTVEVYEKTISAQKVDRFEGIMFFSPSQIDAFLVLNQLPANVVAFCIGSTTANHLKGLNHQNVVVAEKPLAGVLLQSVLNYYKNIHEQTFITKGTER